jgi:hypothetical protein
MIRYLLGSSTLLGAWLESLVADTPPVAAVDLAASGISRSTPI